MVGTGDIAAARGLVDQVYVDEKIKDYVVDLVFATREPSALGLDLGPLIQYGASPRATLALTLAARAHAFLQGRGYVTPQDVKAIAPDVLRHRIVPTLRGRGRGGRRRRARAARPGRRARPVRRAQATAAGSAAADANGPRPRRRSSAVAWARNRWSANSTSTTVPK